MWKLYAALSIVGSGLAACTLQPEASAQSQTESNSASSEPGPTAGLAEVDNDAVQQRRMSMTALYNQDCSKCHGVNGEGGGGGTKSLLTRDKMDQKWDRPFFDAIKKGVPDMGMDPFGQTMSDPEIWGMVVHIRELQAKHFRETEGGPKANNGVFKSKHHDYIVETVVDQGKGLRTPWAIDWLPDGKMLVTNRPGFMSIVVDGQVVGQVSGLPAVVELGQGGLMDVTVHPQYANNGWIYLGFTDPKQGGGGGMTKIVRGKLTWNGNDASWTSQQTLFELDQRFYTSSGVHFGNRIVFDGKGHIFFSIGERGAGEFAQDLARPNGKIYRLTEDGKVPKDNPFVGKGNGTIEAIWSYGHRNPQGLVMDASGNLWDTEHGPRGGDEFNLVKKGANYGWPLVAFSINYNDAPLRTPWGEPGQSFAMPHYRWLPSIGACGLDVLKSDKQFPKWKGDLFAGGLSGANVDRFRMTKDKMVEREEIIWGMGRVREVACGPDGAIYVALNGPDKIVRIQAAK